MKLKFYSSKSPNSQTIWVGDHSLEALTRRSAPPSPKSGRGLWISNTIGVFGISSLHCCQTKQHQNSLLPTSGEGLGMRVENIAASSVITKNSFFLTALGEDILDHKTHLLDPKMHLQAGSLRAWSQLHPYKTQILEART
jgi:hypothetical protein